MFYLRIRGETVQPTTMNLEVVEELLRQRVPEAEDEIDHVVVEYIMSVGLVEEEEEKSETLRYMP